MTRRHKPRRRRSTHSPQTSPSTGAKAAWESYRQASSLAVAGQVAEARQLYDDIGKFDDADARLRTLIGNDRAVLLALEGRVQEGMSTLSETLSADETCQIARTNLETLRQSTLAVDRTAQVSPPQSVASGEFTDRIRVAILSFLFNWPSTAGGIIHTVELARFLAQAGYDVCH